MRHTISFTQDEAVAVYTALDFYVSYITDAEVGSEHRNLVRKAMSKFEAVTTKENEGGDDDEAGSRQSVSDAGSDAGTDDDQRPE